MVKHQQYREKFGCDQCDVKCLSRDSLRTHKLRFHSDNPPKVACKFCSESFPTQTQLLKHKVEQHAYKPKKFKQTEPPPKKVHKKTSQPKEEEIAFCETCNKNFSTSKVLRNHIEIFHSGKEAKIPCPSEGCQKLFINNYQLKLHLKIAHKTGDKRIICESCGASFAGKRNLRTHIERSHLNIRNFACDVCGKSFYAKSFLGKHVRLQKNIFNLNCD
jgi:hypothetical protein